MIAIIMIVSLLFVCFLFFIFYTIKNPIDKGNSLILNMVIVKKFQKDFKTFKVNKILKRNVHFFKSQDEGKNFILEKFKQIGYTEKQSKIISMHPTVYGEYIDKKAFIVPLTSSFSIKGEKVIPIVEKKGGGVSHIIVSKLKEISIKEKEMFSEAINSKPYFKDINNFKSNEEAAMNISKVIEKITGKEVKNKNFESIKLFKESIDKL